MQLLGSGAKIPLHFLCLNLYCMSRRCPLTQICSAHPKQTTHNIPPVVRGTENRSCNCGVSLAIEIAKLLNQFKPTNYHTALVKVERSLRTISDIERNAPPNVR